MLVWGAILPVIFATFGKELGDLVRGNALLSQFAQFGGGDIFSLAGTIALGFVHPFTLLLMGIVAIGFPATAIAGEREKGTLEVTCLAPSPKPRATRCSRGPLPRRPPRAAPGATVDRPV
jgi:hypothetical protein